MDKDSIFMYYKNEYFPWRCIDILGELLRYHKDVTSYENFIRVFMRLELDFIEKYLLVSYKEAFIGRLYILFLGSDEVQHYRNLWKIQGWQKNSQGNWEEQASSGKEEGIL